MFGAVIWRKLNKFKNWDNFGIHNELKWVGITGTFTIVSWVITQIFIVGLGMDAWYIPGTICASTATYWMILAVLYPIYLDKKQQISQKDALIRAKTGSLKDSKISVTGAHETHNIQLMKHWSELVTTSFGFQNLMSHLKSEFSIENLIFLTEVKYRDVYNIYMYIYLRTLITTLPSTITQICMVVIIDAIINSTNKLKMFYIVDLNNLKY